MKSEFLHPPDYNIEVAIDPDPLVSIINDVETLGTVNPKLMPAVAKAGTS